MCGKSYLLLTGELAAVEASINAGCKILEKSGMLLNKSVIPNPDKSIWEKIMRLQKQIKKENTIYNIIKTKNNNKNNKKLLITRRNLTKNVEYI